jgi:pyridoxamine 5'-phosphate oxidase family protein
VEIRGTAEALTDQPPQRPGMSAELIRVHPERVISFGLTEPDAT